MTAYVELRCPLCGKRRLQPPDRATSDRLVGVLSAHLLDAHPDVPPSTAESAMADACEAAEPVDVEDAGAVCRWVVAGDA